MPKTLMVLSCQDVACYLYFLYALRQFSENLNCVFLKKNNSHPLSDGFAGENVCQALHTTIPHVLFLFFISLIFLLSNYISQYVPNNVKSEYWTFRFSFIP